MRNPYVLRPGRPAVRVKNLGWLLRHRREVCALEFNYAPTGAAHDGQLVARLKDGGVYVTDYASLSVCWRWVNRPVFRGLRFVLAQGRDFRTRKVWAIGDAAWMEAQIAAFPAGL